jgi:hypothetical protein
MLFVVAEGFVRRARSAVFLKKGAGVRDDVRQRSLSKGRTTGLDETL